MQQPALDVDRGAAARIHEAADALAANHTMVVCEDGVLLLQADGKITIFRKGKEVENEPMPDVAPKASHWFQRPLR